jgi:hypothetical protein
MSSPQGNKEPIGTTEHLEYPNRLLLEQLQKSYQVTPFMSSCYLFQAQIQGVSTHPHAALLI